MRRSAPTRTVLVSNFLGLRDILSKTAPQLLPPGKVYVANCAARIHSLLAQRDVLALPLGHLAARFRQNVVAQSTRAQVEASQRINRLNGGPAMYGTSDMVFYSMTNWTKAKLFETDFSAAIVSSSGPSNVDSRTPDKGIGKPRYINVYAHTVRGFTLRGATCITGRDPEGNYWIGATLRKDPMQEFVRAVRQLE